LHLFDCLFDLPKWYSSLKHLTMPSVILDYPVDSDNLDEAIKELGGRVFVKMRRSPKDVTREVLESREEIERIIKES
jgi:hypothetical protein